MDIFLQGTPTPVSFNQIWGIIADDLTGANDIGSQFISPHWDVLVIFDSRRLEELWSEKNLVIIDIETRDEKKKRAQELVQKVIGYYKKLKIKNIFLKIDSCLRGNIAGQIEVLMASLGNEVTFVIPAIPRMERYTINGMQIIKGNPLQSVNIKSLLSEDTTLAIDNIRLSDIEQGRVKKRIRDLLKERVKIVICDAKKEKDIKTTLNAIFDLKLSHVLAGSIGLAEQLAACFKFEKRPSVLNTKPLLTRNRSGKKKEGLPLVTIAGSDNPVTRKQVAYAKNAGMEVVEVNLTKTEGNIEAFVNTAVSAVKNLLARKLDVIVTITQSEIRAWADFSKAVSTALGKTGAKIAVDCNISGIMMTGGNISYSVCHHLGSIGVRVRQPFASGVVMGETIGGACPGLRIITKGGSVGKPSLFRDIARNKWRFER